ncbi:MAG: hypothetical protein AAB960_00435 [Patescibacteria group bacterium]
MLTKRTNILFDEELWNLLVTLAVKQKTSVGDLVRSAARKVYDADQKTSSRQRAGEEIRKIRVFQKGHVDYKELINYGRKY